NARAEQAIALRLEGAIVDGFRLGHFTMRPAPDFFRRCQADADSIKISHRICQIERARTKHVPPLSCGSHAPTGGPRLQFSVPGSQFSVKNRFELCRIATLRANAAAANRSKLYVQILAASPGSEFRSALDH